MNIREIEIFRAVMTEGSISRAAERLTISQPAASKYIGQLERRLGLPLFLRKGGRLAPTPEGTALYGQVERLFSGLTELDQFMKDLAGNRRGHLAVACLPLLSLTAMPEFIAGFLEERPSVSIAMQTRSSARIMEWVAAHQVDLGICFCFSQLPGVTIEPLIDLELYCAVPPGDPLESKDIVELSDLNGRDLITYDHLDRTQLWLEALLNEQQIYTRRRVQVFWTSLAMELVMRGVGISVVDRLTASRIPGGLQQLRRFRPAMSFNLSLAWPEHWPIPQLTRSFADQLRAHLDAKLSDTYRNIG
ncbi:LysR substrate-binding domain-containing protein [Bosea sp. (in: a-proteobacteria)]|uniref:LysR family transcriptional regulator n=1 Tax=Bosea sp. (in: a-proteobacteria) TaxID=1871050 RepID=UPI0026230DD6|nr:LysR substrate-binding domain-containing protein [Bosea sp. (in: a-proteobacteria)]MCO5089955.1 LysR substrate-binding domain-containing protein [Bosea sp. (in: a-proteobacteria)]